MVRKAKLKAYEDFCKELSSKCGKIAIYKLTKISDWKNKNMGGVIGE